MFNTTLVQRISLQSFRLQRHLLFSFLTLLITSRLSPLLVALCYVSQRQSGFLTGRSPATSCPLNAPPLSQHIGDAVQVKKGPMKACETNSTSSNTTSLGLLLDQADFIQYHQDLLVCVRSRKQRYLHDRDNYDRLLATTHFFSDN